MKFYETHFEEYINVIQKQNLHPKLEKIYKKFPNSLLSPEKKSFSQCGEDLIVNYIFGLRGITKPTYLDIGANDPFYLNNTALFYINGCRGINIEANKVKASQLVCQICATKKVAEDAEK